MSRADQYSSSGDYDEINYSSSLSEEEATGCLSKKKPIFQQRSTLLSSPLNQLHSSSSSEETTKLACSTLDDSGEKSGGVYDDDDYSGTSGSEGEEMDELYMSRAPTFEKVVPLATLKREVPMGDLVPMPATAATNTTTTTSRPVDIRQNDLRPLTAMTKDEIEVIQMKQDNRLYGLRRITNLSNKKQEELYASQEQLRLSRLAESKRLYVKALDELSPEQLDGLKTAITPLACERHRLLEKRALDELTLEELRELVQECRAHHTRDNIVVVSSGIRDSQVGEKEDSFASPLCQVMDEDTRKLSHGQIKLQKKANAEIQLGVLGLVDSLLDPYDQYPPYRGSYYGGYPYYYGGYPYYGGYGGYGYGGYGGYRGYPYRRHRRYYGADLKNLNDNAEILLKSKNPVVTAATSTTTSSRLDRPLINVNTLPVAEQEAIRKANMNTKNTSNSSPLKSFVNPKSTLTAKKEFELKLGAKMLDSSLTKSLYFGLSKQEHNKGLSCPVHTSDANLMEHIRREHPLFSEMLHKNMNPRLIKSLVNAEDARNFMMVVPSDAILAFYRQQGELLKVAKLATAYLTILLRRGEQIPADQINYQCANLLRDHRVVVRRLDDETLEIDNAMIAKLDPASNGRLYKVVAGGPTIEDLPLVERIEEARAEAEAEAEAEQEAQEEEEAEAELEEEEATELIEAGPTTQIIINTGEAPQVVRSLPAADANELAIVPVEEDLMGLDSRLLTLAGVYKNTQYKNRRFENLASKMLQTQYSGAKDMANYIDYNDSQPHINQLLVKCFSYDTLYDKYRANSTAMVGPERLSASASFVIPSQEKGSLSYNLDTALKMKEFLIDTQKLKISKRQLINHFNVLCFKSKSKKEGEYASLCFSLPDDTKNLTDTYMSSDENLLLKFKDNLLHSVAINTSAANLLMTTMPEVKTSLTTGKPGTVLQHISAQVPMADHASQIYDKELSFEQFMDLVMPLSQPSFFRRAKAALRELVDTGALPLHRVMGSDAILLRTKLDAYEEVSEKTVQIEMTIAEGALEAARSLKHHTYHRVLLRDPVVQHQYMVRYDYDAALNPSAPQLSFNALIKPGKIAEPPVLVIRLLNPLKRKNVTFRFRLASARSPPQEQELFYRAESKEHGLRFDFKLSPGALIETIYIRYVHHVAPLLATPTTTTASITSKGGNFEKDLSKFLATEAYAYKKMQVNVTSGYMTQRLSKIFMASKLSKEDLDTQQHKEFFATLKKEIDAYMEREKLIPLLKEAPDATLTTEKNTILASNNYKEAPLVEEVKRFHAMLRSGFALGKSVAETNTATSTLPSVTNVLNEVISEYATLSKSCCKDVEFAMYMNRFGDLVTAMKSHLFNTKK